MKCTVILDKTREEEIVIYAHQKNEMICEIERMAQEKPLQMTGFLNEEIVRLEPQDIYCFTVEGGRLYAIGENEKYLIKARLYNIEEILDKSFIKINQSSIANVKKIQKFDASISGTLKVIFKNGHTDYVSRRNVKNVKERLGL
ncbi:MAG: LytTR family transcriptional regulator DNA-binding domain-containing protein [Clostridia bacterium]|nr:LytTR family transcriptional regulator DNA-binding domain-containing protein [Clostridia bacterium]